MDACLTQACEAAGGCRLRGKDFAGACSARMYLLIMAIRPDALPTDAAALTEMVLALDAENEKLRVVMRTHPTSAVLSDAWYFAKRVTLSLALRSSGDAGRGFGRVGAAAALVAG